MEQNGDRLLPEFFLKLMFLLRINIGVPNFPVSLVRKKIIPMGAVANGVCKGRLRVYKAGILDREVQL